MYRNNPLPRPVLITADEVITLAAMDSNADLRYIQNSILLAEDRFISPALGMDMYWDMVEQKNKVVTAGNKAQLLGTINASLAAAGKPAMPAEQLVEGMMVNAVEFMDLKYQQLWKNYLWKICADAVHAASIVPSWLRSTAHGQTNNNPKVLTSENLASASGDRNDVQYKMDNMVQSQLSPLIEAMKQWMCKNLWYPLYAGCGCGKKDGVSRRPGGIIMDAYGDRDRRHNEPCKPETAAKPAPTYKVCTLEVEIVDIPDTAVLTPLCNFTAIPKQFAPGVSITISQLAGKTVVLPFYIDAMPVFVFPDASGKIDLTGTEAAGFYTTNKVRVTYNEVFY